MLLSKAMSTHSAITSSVLRQKGSLDVASREKLPGNAPAGSRWHLPRFSSVWKHKVSDENTFCFSEAMFQVAWAQQQRPSPLPSQGSGVLSSFALQASWLSRKQQLCTFLFFLDFPLSLPHLLPSSLFNTSPSPSLQLSIAFCLARLGSTAHHYFNRSL